MNLFGCITNSTNPFSLTHKSHLFSCLRKSLRRYPFINPRDWKIGHDPTSIRPLKFDHAMYSSPRRDWKHDAIVWVKVDPLRMDYKRTGNNVHSCSTPLSTNLCAKLYGATFFPRYFRFSFAFWTCSFLNIVDKYSSRC